MARNLDPGAAAEKDKTATSPAVILRIDFPAPHGQKHYSDRETSIPGVDVEARIVECGAIASDLAAGRRPAAADARIALRDEDGVLRGIVEDVEFQSASATLFQHFEGLPGSAMTPLLSGVVSGPVAYREAGAVLEFDLTDVSRKWAVDVGRTADRAVFPNVAAGDEGRMLPIVYGRVKRARAVAARAGRRGRLLAPATPEDMVLYVTGFEDLPDGTPLSLEIDSERLTGVIAGTVLGVTSRGGGVLANGTTTHETGRQNAIRDENLAGSDNEYVGYALKVFVTGTYDLNDIPYEYRYGGASRLFNAPVCGYEYRPITRFDASTGTVEYWPPFTVEGTRNEAGALQVVGVGHAKLIHLGADYEITTVPGYHPAGALVREVVAGGWTYILNDAPSLRVDAVYLFGKSAP